MPIAIEYPQQLSPQDCLDLQKIYADAPQWLFAPYIDALALIEHNLSKQQLLVARFNDRLVGAAILQRLPRHWLLSHLCVRALTRQRGIGKRILDVACSQAKNSGSELNLLVPQQSTLQKWAQKNHYNHTDTM